MFKISKKKCYIIIAIKEKMKNYYKILLIFKNNNMINL